MPATLHACCNCGADISDKAPNATKCDRCLAPRGGTGKSVANTNKTRVDFLGQTGGFDHDTPTLEQWHRMRAEAPPARATAATSGRVRTTRGMSL